jgi:hypothetical protein
MAEVAVPRQMFQEILMLIAQLRAPPAPSGNDVGTRGTPLRARVGAKKRVAWHRRAERAKSGQVR